MCIHGLSTSTGILVFEVVEVSRQWQWQYFYPTIFLLGRYYYFYINANFTVNSEPPNSGFLYTCFILYIGCPETILQNVNTYLYPK